MPPTSGEQEAFRRLAEDQRLQADSSRASGRIARTYAEALLTVAEKKGQADAIGEELQSLLRDVLETDPRIGYFFENPALSREKKDALLERVFADKASPLFTDFVRVLNRKDRLGLIRLIAVAYRALQDEIANRVPVLVEAAAPLSPAQQDEIAKILADVSGKTPVIVVRHVPELIGGMIVRVRDRVFDTSVRTKLLTLRNQLTARGTHEIQSRRDRFCS